MFINQRMPHCTVGSTTGALKKQDIFTHDFEIEL